MNFIQMKRALFSSLVLLGAFYAFASETEQSDEKMATFQEIIAALHQDESAQDNALEAPEVDVAVETAQPEQQEVIVVDENTNEHSSAVEIVQENEQPSEVAA